jgi:hypothetical protein
VLAHRVSARIQGGRSEGPEECQWILRDILDRVPVPL